MKKLIVATMIAAFGAAVILPAIGSFDSAYAATKKKDKKAAKTVTHCCAFGVARCAATQHEKPQPRATFVA